MLTKSYGLKTYREVLRKKQSDPRTRPFSEETWEYIAEVSARLCFE